MKQVLRKVVYFSVFSVLFIPMMFSMKCSTKSTNTNNSESERKFTPKQELALSIHMASESDEALVNPGKIYIKDNLFLVSDRCRGVHIYDISDITKPTHISFIYVSKTIDMAIKGSALYVDSGRSLVTYDITDVENPIEKSTIPEVFEYNYFCKNEYFNPEGYNTGTSSYNYDSYPLDEGESDMFSCGCSGVDDASPPPSAIPTTSNDTGVSGSMARFTIVGNYLYCVTQHRISIFDIIENHNPIHIKNQSIGVDIETIFPVKDKLFIGSKIGMYIYDISDPTTPVKLSMFQHGTACDPVVVRNNLAYVTLRSGNKCGASKSELLIIDVSELTEPVLKKTYPMTSPYGLAVDSDHIFICEGINGFKILDGRNIFNLIEVTTLDIDSYDVILIEPYMFVVGSLGFYIYDYTNINEPELMSKILKYGYTE